MSSQSTDITKFRPTPHMEKWLATELESQESSPKKISELSGIDKSTYYYWLKNPDFIVWYRAEWDKRLQAAGPMLDKIGLNKSKYDFKFWEAMQKRVGNLSEKPSSTTAVQVNNFIKGEKDEFGI